MIKPHQIAYVPRERRFTIGEKIEHATALLKEFISPGHFLEQSTHWIVYQEMDVKRKELELKQLELANELCRQINEGIEKKEAK